MRCLFKFIFAGGITLILFVYFSLYFITPGFMVKRSIQEYLDSKFDRRFTIVSIANNYSPDFLHQVTGYKLTLKDQNGTEITPVFFKKIIIQEDGQAIWDAILKHNTLLPSKNNNFKNTSIYFEKNRCRHFKLERG